MRYALEVEPDSGLAVGRLDGAWDLQGARNAVMAVWSTEGWNGRAFVFDVRRARLDGPPAEIESFARFVLDHQPLPPPRRVAFVTGDDLNYGILRMFEVYREHARTETRVMRDLDEALEWAREA